MNNTIEAFIAGEEEKAIHTVHHEHNHEAHHQHHDEEKTGGVKV